MMSSRYDDRFPRSGSVHLVTLSSDGQFVFSLIKSDSYGKYTIDTHHSPITSGDRAPENEPQDDNSDNPTTIRTQLPEMVSRALDIDSAVELICVDGEAISSSKKTKYCKLPPLCLYTRKNAFLLHIEYNNSRDSRSLAGKIVSFKEPFERQLERHRSTIIRIRPAPQRFTDHATVSPGNSMAALLYNKDVNEYSIVLHHADGTVTAPTEFRGPEDVADADLGRMEEIVDFCFAQSFGLSIFSSMTILLLKGSGEIMSACPIVFQGAVVAKSFIQEGIDFLQGVREQTIPDRNSPKFRQFLAAQQYLIDVFGASRTSQLADNSSFSSAQVLVPSTVDSAASWPVSIQGPIVIQHVDENVLSSFAVTIESFGGTDNLAGVAIGKTSYEVDFVALSPTSFIPRFAFESVTDAYTLNDELYKLSAIVERVSLANGLDIAGDLLGPFSLLRDPIESTLMHCITSKLVGTISTNCLKVASRNLLCQEAQDEATRTTAWSSINVASANKFFIGAVVACRNHMEHELIARMSDGSTEHVNMTHAQFLHELEGMTKSEHSKEIIAFQGQANVKELMSPPFYEKIDALIKNVTSGLSSFSKLVGTETKFTDITPDVLAVALKLKERSDKEVVMPLLELRSLVDNRRQLIKVTIDLQKKQLKEINENVNILREKMKSLMSKMEQANDNAATLAERSKLVVQAANDLLPKVTVAESEYFQDIQRLDRKVFALQYETKKLIDATQTQCRSIDEDKIKKAFSLADATMVDTANRVLKGQDVYLQVARARIKEKEQHVSEIRCKIQPNRKAA